MEGEIKDERIPFSCKGLALAAAAAASSSLPPLSRRSSTPHTSLSAANFLSPHRVSTSLFLLRVVSAS
jgi:hypothetical protein